jgi:hypothetical protein
LCLKCFFFNLFFKFFFSGFILSYGLLGKLEKTNGKFNFFSYLIQRWIRFSVPIFGSFLFIHLLPISGDGPIWEYGINWIIPSCKDWKILLTSFLYISNFNCELQFLKGISNYPIVRTYLLKLWRFSIFFLFKKKVYFGIKWFVVCSLCSLKIFLSIVWVFNLWFW